MIESALVCQALLALLRELQIDPIAYVDQLPDGVDTNRIVDRWLYWMLSDFLASYEVSKPVAELYRRRLAEDEPKKDEWEAPWAAGAAAAGAAPWAREAERAEAVVWAAEAERAEAVVWAAEAERAEAVEESVKAQFRETLWMLARRDGNSSCVEAL